MKSVGTRKWKKIINVTRDISIPRGILSLGTPYFPTFFAKPHRRFNIGHVQMRFLPSQRKGNFVSAASLLHEEQFDHEACLGFEEGVAIQKMGSVFFYDHFRHGNEHSRLTYTLILTRSTLKAPCGCCWTPRLSLACADVELDWIVLQSIRLCTTDIGLPVIC